MLAILFGLDNKNAKTCYICSCCLYHGMFVVVWSLATLFSVLNNALVFQEVIPYLNEHMEDNCTGELLGYIRNLVLSRIQVNEDQVQLVHKSNSGNSVKRTACIEKCNAF